MLLKRRTDTYFEYNSNTVAEEPVSSENIAR